MFNFFKRLLSPLFAKRSPKPEDEFVVTLTDDDITVAHPERKTESVRWDDVQAIKVLTTDAGPFFPDVWFVLIGTNGGCVFPQGAPNAESAYDRISQFDGFDFETFIHAMSSAKNEEFLLWSRTGPVPAENPVKQETSS